MSTQNLKFIHLSTGSASDHKADTGAIIFEKASGRIAVADGTNVEYYGGGRVSDAKFENSILTISFNDTAETIKLDFSDVASTSGVNKILGQLRTDVDALKVAVGDASNGLVKDVATNASNIKANKEAIDKINAADTGILATAKSYTDGKLTALKGGYTGTLQSLDDKIASNDTDIAALQELHASDGANGKKTVAEEIVDKVGSGITGTVKDYVDGKVSDINSAATTLKGRVDTLESDVDALETKVGDENSGLVKNVADLSKLHADKSDKTGKLTVAEEVTAGINTKVGGITGTVKDYVDGKVSGINSAAATLKGRVDTLETKVGSSDDGADAEGSVYARIAKNAGDIATLVGDDASKSVRKIANEELAAQLIPGNAAESLDTLQEIAAWIQAHPGDASEMNKKIGDLEGIVGDLEGIVGKPAGDNTEATGLVKKVNDNASAINALQGLHASGKTVATEVSEGIAGIAEVSKTNDTGDPKTADVVVTVTTKSGSVSAVSVDAKVLRDAVDANKSAIDTEKSRAEKAEGDLRTDLNALSGDLGTKGEGKGTAFARIEALEKKQADGSLIWSVWD